MSTPNTQEQRLNDLDHSLLAYVLQDDMHNRLTPRVVDIAYSAFMAAKKPNQEDGGPSDWFNDTKPMITEAIEKLRRDLFAETADDQWRHIQDAASVLLRVWRPTTPAQKDAKQELWKLLSTLPAAPPSAYVATTPAESDAILDRIVAEQQAEPPRAADAAPQDERADFEAWAFNTKHVATWVLEDLWMAWQARAALPAQAVAPDGWRDLALQFDGHRMQALAHLRLLLAHPQEHAGVVAKFLAAPPLSSEKVLADRVAALAAPVQADAEAPCPCPDECQAVQHCIGDCEAAPVAPTDDELINLANEHTTSLENVLSPQDIEDVDVIGFARAVLARWGAAHLQAVGPTDAKLRQMLIEAASWGWHEKSSGTPYDEWTVRRRAHVDILLGLAAIDGAPQAGVAPTDAQIDAILDEPGTLDYVIADKRGRMRLFARRVLALGAPQAGVQAALLTDIEHKALTALIDTAASAYHAADDSEDDDGDITVPAESMGALENALDVLDELPDDQPGYTLGPAGRARWALRRLLGTDGDAAQPAAQPADAQAGAYSSGLKPRDPNLPAEAQGLFRKYHVTRLDGTDAPGGKHHGCELFVLDLTHDPHAQPAVVAYAIACRDDHPQLSADLLAKWGGALLGVQSSTTRDALVTAEAALADIGDADREPGDDVAWCEARAAQALPAVRAVLAAPEAQPADHEFKNFHRLLCERFGYSHDDRDWRRDQLSLIEFISNKLGSMPACPFSVGQPVKKVTGEYRIGGIVRAVFAKGDGVVRLVVEHQAEGGGSFLHVYGPNNLEATGDAPPQRDHAEYLRGLLEDLQHADVRIARFSHEARRRDNLDRGVVWYWQTDGNNKLASITCDVVIKANDLRALLAPVGRPPAE